MEATGYGNLPSWAEHEPSVFWTAADRHERANGTTYREIEIALPRELNPAQRQELVLDFIRQEIGERHAHQWAIHNPVAALAGEEQPHAHIMYSEQTLEALMAEAKQREQTQQQASMAEVREYCQKAYRELQAKLAQQAEREREAKRSRQVQRGPETELQPEALPSLDEFQAQHEARMQAMLEWFAQFQS